MTIVDEPESGATVNADGPLGALNLGTNDPSNIEKRHISVTRKPIGAGVLPDAESFELYTYI